MGEGVGCGGGDRGDRRGGAGGEGEVETNNNYSVCENV